MSRDRDRFQGAAGLAPRLGAEIRSVFPLWAGPGAGLPAFLDSASSTQKPKAVIDRLCEYLSHEHANIHRGAYRLSAEATLAYEGARERARQFINAVSANSIVFVRGTTEAINLVSASYGAGLSAGDVVMLSLLEHHSNIVPWQLLRDRIGVKLVFSGITDDGRLDLESFRTNLAAHKPKIVAITHIANAIGTINPIETIVNEAHRVGAKVLVDAAQSAAHSHLDVRALDADFVAFSGHKIYGPTGIGILFAKEELLEQMPPYQGGGDMIESVSVEMSTWAKPPSKFEAGTPAIAEAIALESALEFIDSLDRRAIAEHELSLTQRAFDALSRAPGISLYGPITAGREQGAILSFNLKGVHPHDLATIADSFGVQIRSGHHCAMPLLNRLGLQSTARISFGVYSCFEDVERLIEAIAHARKIFA